MKIIFYASFYTANHVYVPMWVRTAWCIEGLKAKNELRPFIYLKVILKKKSKYCLNSILLLDAKLLINMNYLEFFLFENVYRYKKFDKTFYTCWCDRLIMVSKKVTLVKICQLNYCEISCVLLFFFLEVLNS